MVRFLRILHGNGTQGAAMAGKFELNELSGADRAHDAREEGAPRAINPDDETGDRFEWTATMGDRLDRAITVARTDLSRSRAQKLIAGGCVSVNDRCEMSKHAAIVPGDRLRVRIPSAVPLDLVPQPIPLDILYEDRHVIVVNKPAGIVVHPAPGHWDGTLVNALLHHCKTLPGLDMPAIGGVQRPGVVHRLDRDTTGAIVFAKTDLANQHLQAQLRHKIAHREYLGLVYGNPSGEHGTVDRPLGRHPVDRKKQAIVPEENGGRRAITQWFVEERLGNYTLMRFLLKTGRTHQIRVHCTDLGHPIVGDPVYGSGRRIGVNLTGQALHAWRLQFQHPKTDEWICAEAPPPPEFATLLDVLRRRH